MASKAHNVMNQAIFRRICMESLEYNCGNISPTICINMLILDKDTFLPLISQMISTNPIDSKILIFVTSHFPLYSVSFLVTLFLFKNSFDLFFLSESHAFLVVSSIGDLLHHSCKKGSIV